MSDRWLELQWDLISKHRQTTAECNRTPQMRCWIATAIKNRLSHILFSIITGRHIRNHGIGMGREKKATVNAIRRLSYIKMLAHLFLRVSAYYANIWCILVYCRCLSHTTHSLKFRCCWTKAAKKKATHTGQPVNKIKSGTRTQFASKNFAFAVLKIP